MSPRESAEVFDAVAWGFDPADDELTALASTERWFERFPWEPDGETHSESDDDPDE
jgi:hypothetical protein